MTKRWLVFARWVWQETSVQVFLERFVLTVLAAVFGACLFNPMNFDIPQRISLGLAAIALAYFVGHTLNKEKAQQKPEPVAAAPAPKEAAPEKKDIPVTPEKQTPSAINVTSNNQQGGITAGIVNVHQTPPTWGLSPSQLTILSARMAPFATKEDRGDFLTCVMGDGESMRFTQSLVGAFRQAGWNLSGTGFNVSMFTAVIDGVRIIIHSQDSQPAGLGEFVRTLRENGIEPIGEVNPAVPQNHFRVVVGIRPEGR